MFASSILTRTRLSTPNLPLDVSSFPLPIKLYWLLEDIRVIADFLLSLKRVSLSLRSKQM